MEASDPSVEAALHREMAEELGAEVSLAAEGLVINAPTDIGATVQHFFLARLLGMDESARTGPELDDQSRGGYDVDRIALDGDDLAALDLKPRALRSFILANREALLAELRLSG